MWLEQAFLILSGDSHQVGTVECVVSWCEAHIHVSAWFLCELTIAKEPMLR